jgi:hypothetical protein
VTGERGDSSARDAARSLCPWAELMRRVFAIDVLEWPRCQGPMKVLAQIHPPDTIRESLQCLGLRTRARCNRRDVELRDDSAVIGRHLVSIGAIELKGTHHT